MNAAKMTLASTMLAAALGLALGLMAAPAGADCPHRDNPDHKHCDGGDGGDGGKPPKDSGPANPAIAFSTGHTWPIYEIKVMDADGGNQTSVLDGGLASVREPSWSPDGRFLAFFAFQSILGCPDGPGLGLVELDPDTNEWSAPIQLVCERSGAGTPAFSPEQIGDTYTLAYFGRHGATPFPDEPDGRIADDIIATTFDAPDSGSVTVTETVNITNTAGISENSPSWSPSAGEIVVAALDISADPDDPATWVEDIVIYDAAGGGKLASLVRENPAFDGMAVDDVDDPDWAKTSAEMILFRLKFVGGDWDIWCVERSTGAAVNVTQHLDETEGAERIDWAPSWLPDDSGFLFSRDNDRQIIEMRFGDGYNPADGCPDASNLISATNVVLAQGKGRRKVGGPDYWRNAP